MQMRIVHLSDTHILGDYAGGLLDFYQGSDNLPADVLRKTLTHLAENDAPDLVIISGDLVHEGEASDYTLLDSIMLDVLGDIPFLYALGNHDREKAFFAAVLGEPEREGAYYYARNFDAIRVIVLDSSHDKSGTGYVSREQLDWLSDTLEKPAEGGSVLVLHHPPFLGDGTFMLSHCLKNSDALLEAIEGGDIRLILSGHTHQPSFTQFGGIPHSTAGSTAFGLELTPEEMAMTDGLSYTVYDIDERSITAFVRAICPSIQVRCRTSMAQIIEQMKSAVQKQES